MPTAQVVLRDLLRSTIAPALREAGFSGSGQDFHRRIAGNWAAINVQRDRYSTAEELRFTVNLGTASTVVRAEDGFAPDEPAREIECHWRERIGRLLDPPRDKWWTVRAGMSAGDASSLGGNLTDALLRRAVPRLEQMASDTAILSTVLDGEPRAGMSSADMDVVGPILRSLGPPERFAAFLAILDLPEEGEAAAAIYTMFDDFPLARMGEKRIAKRLGDLAAARRFEPRQDAIMNLGYAPPSEAVSAAIRPFLADPDWRLRFVAAQALGRLRDASSRASLVGLVRLDPVRAVAVHAAFALARFDDALDAGQRAEVRSAFEDRRGRAVGHDRAVLSHLLRRVKGR